MLNLFKTFKNDESGAVTVDWVVLTAAIVGLGMLIMAVIGPEIRGAAYGIAFDVHSAQYAGY